MGWVSNTVIAISISKSNIWAILKRKKCKHQEYWNFYVNFLVNYYFGRKQPWIIWKLDMCVSCERSSNMVLLNVILSDSISKYKIRRIYLLFQCFYFPCIDLIHLYSYDFLLLYVRVPEVFFLYFILKDF